MKKYIFSLGLSMAILAVNGTEPEQQKTAVAEQPQKGTVKANVLNVRVKPGVKYSAVSKLKRGDEVTIVRKNKDWYEIVLPANASTWIAASLVKENKTVTDAKLRAGPSISHEDYTAIIPADTELTIQDKTKAEWLKVAPPSTLTGWVSCENVQVGDAPVTKTEETSATATKPDNTKEKKIVNKDAKEVKETKDSKGAKKAEVESLPFILGMDKDVTIEGFLFSMKGTGTKAVYVTHMLMKQQKDKYVLYCFLHSTKLSLDSWNEKKVQIKGKQRMVRGWKTPVVEVEKISPAL